MQPSRYDAIRLGCLGLSLMVCLWVGPACAGTVSGCVKGLGHRGWFQVQPSAGGQPLWVLDSSHLEKYPQGSCWTFETQRTSRRGAQIVSAIRQPTVGWINRLHLWRTMHIQRFARALGRSDAAGVLLAMVLGDRQGLSPKLKARFRSTGISHLIAISGLHVGLVMVLLRLMVKGVLWCVPGLRCDGPRLSGVVGLLCALGYVLVVGAPVTAIRAFGMLGFGAVAQMMGWSLARWWVYAVCVLIGVLIAPSQVCGPSFMMSYLAVFWIFYAIREGGGWRSGLRMQQAVSLGLMPVCLWYFGQMSVSGLWVNVVAIPWVSVVVFPLCFLSWVLWCLGWSVCGPVLALVEWSLQGVAWVDRVCIGPWVHPVGSWWFLWAALVGVGLLLLPRGVPGRAMGWMCCLGLFW